MAPATQVKLAEISVYSRPPGGQTWRCSNNFGISPPNDVQSLRWEISGPDSANITFAVAQDVTWGPDYPLQYLTHVTNNQVTALPNSNNRDDIYIGGVEGAGQDFKVTIFGVTG